MKAFGFALLSVLVLLVTTGCPEVSITGANVTGGGDNGSGQNTGNGSGQTPSGGSVTPGNGGGSSSVDPIKQGPSEITNDERGRCLRGSTKNLKVVVVDGVQKEVNIDSSEALAIIIRGVGSEVSLNLSKGAAGNSIILCVFARGLGSQVDAKSSAKLDYLLYDARGAGNQMEIEIGGGGSLAGGRVNLLGAFNEFELEKESDAGTVVCPEVNDQGPHNSARCRDDEDHNRR